MNGMTARLISCALLGIMLLGKYWLPNGLSLADKLMFTYGMGGVIFAWMVVYKLFIWNKSDDDARQGWRTFWQLALFTLLCYAGTQLAWHYYFEPRAKAVVDKYETRSAPNGMPR